MKKFILLLTLVSISLPLFSQKLYMAVEKNDHSSVERLLKAGENPNKYHKNGLFPLWRASADNQQQIVKLLLAYGDEVNMKIKVSPARGTALEMACQEGHIEIVRLLIENGAQVNEKGYRGFTPIRIASRNGHIEMYNTWPRKGDK